MLTLLAEPTNEIMESIPQEQGEVFYQSAEFWVGVSFILVVYLLIRPACRAIKSMIDARIKRIKDELEDAENLKIKAQKLYADYERKYLNTDNEIAKILENENSIIAENKKRKLYALETWLKQKNIEADAKMEIAFERANQEINSLITKRAIEIIKDIFCTVITKKEHENLIDKSIEKLESIEIHE